MITATNETTYTLTTETCSQGSYYVVTGTLGESTVVQRFFASKEQAEEIYALYVAETEDFGYIPRQPQATEADTEESQVTTYTELKWQPVAGMKGEWFALIDSEGFSLNISKSWRGYQVTTTDHTADEVMHGEDLADLANDGEWYTKTLTNAKEIANGFLQTWIYNLAEA